MCAEWRPRVTPLSDGVSLCFPCPPHLTRCISVLDMLLEKGQRELHFHKIKLKLNGLAQCEGSAQLPLPPIRACQVDTPFGGHPPAASARVPEAEVVLQCSPEEVERALRGSEGSEPWREREEVGEISGVDALNSEPLCGPLEAIGNFLGSFLQAEGQEVGGVERIRGAGEASRKWL